MKLDTPTLTTIIDQCFDYAGDARLSPADRLNFLVLGKRLRGCLLNLLSAQFNDGTPQVVTANNDLVTVNTQLSNDATVLASTATTIQNITQLVGDLDALLQLAAKFV